MKIAIGCDHGALALKESVKKVLAELGMEIDDVGTYTEDSVDYPDIAERFAGKSSRATRSEVWCFAAPASVSRLRRTRSREFAARFAVRRTRRGWRGRTTMRMCWLSAGACSAPAWQERLSARFSRRTSRAAATSAASVKLWHWKTKDRKVEENTNGIDGHFGTDGPRT